MNLSKSTHIQHHEIIRLASDPLDYLLQQRLQANTKSWRWFYEQHKQLQWRAPEQKPSFICSRCNKPILAHSDIHLQEREQAEKEGRRGPLDRCVPQLTLVTRQLCKNLWRIFTRTNQKGCSTQFPTVINLQMPAKAGCMQKRKSSKPSRVF